MSEAVPGALPASFPKSITKELINSLPLCRYDGPIHLVSGPDDLPMALRELEQETILGFDTETRPSFQRGDNYPVALLQLCGSRGVWLFQLGWLPQPGPLFEVLANPSILKVGVAIHDDIKKLRDLSDFAPAGFVEVSQLSSKAGIVNTGLRALAAMFLGCRISKAAQVTNWSRRILTEQQLNYAATDAWVSREVYLRLRELGLNGA